LKRRDDGLLCKRITLNSGAKKDVYAHNKKELEYKINEVKKLDVVGLIETNINVTDWCNQWFINYKSMLRYNTQEAIKNSIKHITDIIGTVRLRDVKQVHVQQVMKSISKYSESLQHKVLNVAKQVFSAAVDNHLIPFNPANNIKTTKHVVSQKIKLLTDEQQYEILNISKNTRAELFVLFGLYAGLRREEILALMWGDINFTDETVTVQRCLNWVHNQPVISNELKSESANRIIPLPEILLDKLKATAQNNIYIISDTNDNLMSNTAYRRLWDIAGKRISFKCTSHMLRHTYCSKLIAAGIDIKTVQYLMGHSNSIITLQIYAHVTQSALKDAAKKIKQIQ
jgi:integrase